MRLSDILRALGDVSEITRLVRQVVESKVHSIQPKDDAKSDNKETRHNVVVELKLPESIVEQYYAAQERERRRDRARYRMTTGIAAATVLVGIFYVAASYNQVKATREVVEQTERAWVIGMTASVDYGNGVARAHAVARNSGKSPALHVRGRIKLLWQQGDPPVIPVAGIGEILLSPSPDHLVTYTSEEEISREGVAQLLAGKRTLFIWLEIKYSDPFSGDLKERETLECWVYNFKLSKTPLICPSGQRHT